MLLMLLLLVGALALAGAVVGAVVGAGAGAVVVVTRHSVGVNVDNHRGHAVLTRIMLSNFRHLHCKTCASRLRQCGLSILSIAGQMCNITALRFHPRPPQPLALPRVVHLSEQRCMEDGAGTQTTAQTYTVSLVGFAKGRGKLTTNRNAKLRKSCVRRR